MLYPKRTVLVGSVLSIVFFLVLIFFLFFVTVVDAGEVGVVSTFGKVNDAPLYSGINLKNPFAKVVKLSIRTNEYTMSSATYEGLKVGDDSIQARAKDGASVWLDITVFYHLRGEDAPKVYKELGVEYEEKILRPEVRSAIREVVAQYSVNEIYSTKRTEVTDSIKNNLQGSLDPRGIEVEDALLRNVTLSETLANSIEDKLTAQQEAEKLDFLLEKETKEAQRKVIEAEGQRDAQSIINQSLTDKYLYYLYITSLKDLDGTIYVPTEGGLPLFKNVE